MTKRPDTHGKLPEDFTVAPVEFSSVQSVLHLLQQLEEHRVIRRIDISDLAFKYKLKSNADITKLFVVSTTDETYYLPEVESAIVHGHSGLLNHIQYEIYRVI